VLPLISVPPGASVWPNSSKNIQKIVNLTTLSGPPAKSQLCGAVHSAYQKQPTGGCTNQEVACYEAHTFGDGGSRTDGGDGS
jgi:hypothetical protein